MSSEICLATHSVPIVSKRLVPVREAALEEPTATDGALQSTVGPLVPGQLRQVLAQRDGGRLCTATERVFELYVRIDKMLVFTKLGL